MSKKKDIAIEDKNRWYKGWDKSSLAAMIANALTLLTLMYTCKQNNISDNRYFENDSTDRIEKNRVSKRDSSQTTLLIEELIEQRTENKRLRVRDSIDLTLYKKQLSNLNLSIQAQYQILEIQRLASKSDLTFKIQFKDIESIDYGGLMNANVILRNTGKTRAEDISVNFLFLHEYNWNKQSYYGYAFSRALIYDTRLSPDSSRYIQHSFPYSEGFYLTEQQEMERNREMGKYFTEMMSKTTDLSAQKPTKEVWNNNFYRTKREMNNLQEQYPDNPYSLYLITHISYKDKFLNKYNEVYITNRIRQHKKDDITTSFRIEPIDRLKLNKFKKTIQYYGFDFKRIIEASAYVSE